MTLPDPGAKILTCGIDEAGRGPLAGPVVAACVHIPPEKKRLSFWRHVDDSKKLTGEQRADLYDKIVKHAPYGVGQASKEEIDELNIHHATLLAMKRAYEAMTAAFSLVPSQALIDGKFCPALPCRATAVVGGDGLHLPIAAASIIAKVTRDRIMWALHEKFPLYGWNTNVGYSTPGHIEAIKLYGITIHHRRNYERVKQYSLLDALETAD